MDWLFIAGGIGLLLYSIWLFADFVTEALVGRLRGYIVHY